MKIILYIVLLISPVMSIASHIIGGSIHYEDLGNGDYSVVLTLYRDCSSNTEYDDPASIGCFDNAGNLVYNLEIALSDAIVSSVDIESTNACYMAPLGLCVEEAIYSATVNLPPIAGGYTLTYQRCCRNFSIINVPTGTDVGITLTTTIPGPELVTPNTNPEFFASPPLVICLGAPFTFDHSAFDADGDELVYSFCAPLNVNVSGSYINPPGAPPYPDLSYNAGYSSSYPIDASPAFSIDPVTGLITGTPTMLGQFVIGVCIQEYRNGVLINETNRDFQLNVTTCDLVDSPAIQDQDNICGGLTVGLVNGSATGLTYFWDFGVESMQTDTSSLYSPTYTYPQPGYYDVMLVLNPGLPCADTAYSTFYAAPAISASIDSVLHDCPNLNSLEFAFYGSGGTTDAAIFNWDFGNAASPESSSQEDVTHVQFSSAGTQTVALTVMQDGCSETVSYDLEIPEPIMASIEPQNTFCDGYTYQMVNLSLGAEDYQWIFGNGPGAGFSIEHAPLYTFPDTGLYQVRLIASMENLCPDTAETSMLIYGLLDPFFETPEPQCLSNNSFSFLAEGASTNEASYFWEFGSSATPLTSNAQSPTGIHIFTEGRLEIALTITENDCIETYTDSIDVILDPQFSAIADTVIGCGSAHTNFHGTSIAQTEVAYFWDFGDGESSSEVSPGHTYTSPGSYDVLVTMETNSGCIDSETMTFNNVVLVNAPPVAGFVFSDNNLALPGVEIEVQSTTDPDLSYAYVLSDGGVYYTGDFTHLFNTAGFNTVIQTVVDELGCSASVTGTLLINGYVFYAPNTFTPDGDGLNDVWKPEMAGIQEYELSIYNRWGDMIFQTNDMDQPWTGDVHDGEYYAQDGVYTYVVVANDILGYPHEFEGHIVVIR